MAPSPPSSRASQSIKDKEDIAFPSHKMAMQKVESSEGLFSAFVKIHVYRNTENRIAEGEHCVSWMTQGFRVLCGEEHSAWR